MELENVITPAPTSKFSKKLNLNLSRDATLEPRKQQRKMKNQLSILSNVESAKSLINSEDPRVNAHSTVRKPKHKIRRRMKKRKMVRESIAKLTIEHLLSKRINVINPDLEPAFKYYNQDIHDLAEDPEIKKKLEHAGDFISPRYLIGLKKKQRMHEYWKSRVRKDFTKLSESSNSSFEIEPILEKVPKKAKHKVSKTNVSPNPSNKLQKL